MRIKCLYIAITQSTLEYPYHYQWRKGQGGTFLPPDGEQILLALPCDGSYLSFPSRPSLPWAFSSGLRLPQESGV